MTKEETYHSHVYVEGHGQRPLPVGMYTDEHSEICSIRFSNSFTLNVVSPQDLMLLAQELLVFADRAHSLHYPHSLVNQPVGEVMADLQHKLEACGVIDPLPPYDPEDTVARTMAEETMMKGTVSGPVWKDPSDPVNW